MKREEKKPHDFITDEDGRINTTDSEGNTSQDFVAYEEARMDKSEDKAPEEATDKEVESANKIINPDKHSMDSRG